MLQTTTYKETPYFFGVDYTKKGIATKVRINYTTFGAPMPGRNFNSTDYRYGFNGKEKIDEINGGGNEYDFGARFYDSRLGKWLSIDPEFKIYPQSSHYSFALNNPIKFIDVAGKFVVDPTLKEKYPTVALILENADLLYNNQQLPQNVLDALGTIDYKKIFDEVFRQAFKDASEANPEKIQELLKNGSGPTIGIGDFDVWDKKKQEFVPTANGVMQPRDFGNILIDNEILGVLEYELNPGGKNPLEGLGGKGTSIGDRQVAFKVFIATTFHEGVHWLRMVGGKGAKKILPDGSSQEAGKYFERKKFKLDQGRLRVKDLQKSTEKERTEAESDKRQTGSVDHPYENN